MDFRKVAVAFIAAGILAACGWPTAGARETVAPDRRLNGNMVFPANDLPSTLREENSIWRIDLQSKHVYGQPVFAGRCVLIGMDARTFSDRARFPKHRADLVCLERDTGKLLWHVPSGSEGPWWAGHGVTSTPWVEGDRVYVLLADGRAVCLDLEGLADGNDGPFRDEKAVLKVEELLPTDADLIWHYDFAKKHHIRAHDSHSSDPLIVNGVCIFATGHAAAVRPTPAWTDGKAWDNWRYTKRPYLLALDKETGKLVAQDDLEIEQVFHGQWSSPILVREDGKSVIAWGDGYGMLHGFEVPRPGGDGTFKHLWQVDVNPSEFRHKDGESLPFPRHKARKETKAFGPSHIIATPVFHEGRLYVGTGRDHYYTYRPGGRIGTPGVFRCIDVSDPTDVTTDDFLWEQRIVVTQSTASVTGDLVFVTDGGGVLRCFDACTGELYWEHDLGAAVTCRAQVVADGKLYVGTDRRTFFILRADRDKEVLFEGKLDGQSATPGLSDGMLILATERSITAYRPALTARARK